MLTIMRNANFNDRAVGLECSRAPALTRGLSVAALVLRWQLCDCERDLTAHRGENTYSLAYIENGHWSFIYQYFILNSLLVYFTYGRKSR